MKNRDRERERRTLQFFCVFYFAYFNILLVKTINKLVAGVFNRCWCINNHGRTCIDCSYTVSILIDGCVIMIVLNVSQKLLFVRRLGRGSTIFEIMSLIMNGNVIYQGIVMDCCGSGSGSRDSWHGHGWCCRDVRIYILWLICQVEASPCFSFYNRILDYAHDIKWGKG